MELVLKTFVNNQNKAINSTMVYFYLYGINCTELAYFVSIQESFAEHLGYPNGIINGWVRIKLSVT